MPAHQLDKVGTFTLVTWFCLLKRDSNEHLVRTSRTDESCPQPKHRRAQSPSRV
ncbi:uncharacterized protein MYCGRDRAFT_102437 [Zymoseptoria tritici IPO323]|uniref:Uncharacterized protein n=1 Tax=Zymoseptoria tritici (strain CBS 115943 / IPO323) TaxID=336722 RepID=F9X031_ZYMTI|nr:uncharacterized protein MYCGRDRAFT_102437 [Zymoseptoria tritici IPO323]EGP92342.1 hypothetical protein MYCGRDRAFT_102437 [Zymoseptoria tritici IPO323]